MSVAPGSALTADAANAPSDMPAAQQVAELPKSLPAPKTPNKTLVDPSPDTASEPEPVKTLTVNTTLIAEIDSTIIVKLDGETLESTEVHRSETGELYVNAMPIFQHLANEVEFDDVSKALIVRRSQDGVVMELYTDTGIVKADGRPLGQLKHFGEVSEEQFILTPNAIAVLAGAAGKFDADANEFRFKLDPRLRVVTGFDIFVEDVPLGAISPKPKSVGPVLLLPLLPIAQALGDDVEVIDGGAVVTVRRAQDSVEMSLNLTTGLVSARGAPIGLSKDIAYIDPINLLLPSSTIEALTGTHIEVEAGSHHIQIRLDDRLTGAIEPSSDVDSATKDAPFTLEDIVFQVSPDTGARVQVDAHMGRVNGRLRYEVPDLPENGAEFRPSWLSVDFAHTNGLSGSVGDYAARYRELDPVGARRIVGVATHKTTDHGRWALAVGAPETGSVDISKDQSRLEFGGVVAGLRYADRKGWEAGLAVAKDNLSGDQQAVLQAISGRLGRNKDKLFQWDASASLGLFDGPAREDNVDFRAEAYVRHDLSKGVSLDIRGGYNGSEFLRSDLQGEKAQAAQEANLVQTNKAQSDIRYEGADEGHIAVGLRYVPRGNIGFLRDPSLSTDAQIRQNSLLKKGAVKSTLTSLSGGAGARIGPTGVTLNVSGRHYQIDETISARTDEASQSRIRGQSLNVQAYKKFNNYTLRGQYNLATQSNLQTRQSAVATISRESFSFGLPKGAGLVVGPSLSGGWTPETWRARAGVTANLHSGDIFGKKNTVQASFGILQMLSNQGNSQNSKFLTVSAARKLPIGKNMSLGLGYRNDLRGNHRLGLQLNGNFQFNAKRAIKKTEKDRGILTGQAFLDKNRDGVRQEHEPGIPRTVIRVKGTSMALRSGADGFFTIQNIKTGIYELQIDGSSLPLGYALADDQQTRVSIADGQITDIALPIVRRGQIRGFAFEDENENGAYDKGETRVEGAQLRLQSQDGDVEKSTVTTSFGQYAFDDLPEGDYSLAVVPLEAAHIAGGGRYDVNLDSGDDLMMGRQNVTIQRGQPDPKQDQKRGPKQSEVVIEDVEASNEPSSAPPVDMSPKGEAEKDVTAQKSYG